MLVQDPKDPFLNYALSLELAKKNDLQDAISILEKLIEQDPDYLAAYYQLGKNCEAIAEKQKAILIYQRGIAIARKQNNTKTMNELMEACQLLEE